MIIIMECGYIEIENIALLRFSIYHAKLIILLHLFIGVGQTFNGLTGWYKTKNNSYKSS